MDNLTYTKTAILLSQRMTVLRLGNSLLKSDNLSLLIIQNIVVVLAESLSITTQNAV